MAVLSCKDENTIVLKKINEGISLSADIPGQTKAFMDNTSLKTTGNRLRVLDELVGFSGTVSWMGQGNPYYINDEIQYAGTTIWNYTSGRVYPWTSDGQHTFFSWLSYDAALDKTAEQFCNLSFNPSTKTLSIPTKTMPDTAIPYDFMYSGVTLVDAENHTAGAPVNLDLRHLFTAMKLTVNNTSGSTILLKSVTLSGMKNRRSATIAFTAANPVVSTSDLSSTNVVLFTSQDPDGDTYIDEDVEKNLSDFIMMWPQTFSELSGAQLIVVYNTVDGNGQVSNDLSANIVLSNQTIFSQNNTGMDAGTKYTFLLQFKTSSIDIFTTALPWEYEEYDWDYSDHSISARGGMFKDGVLAFYRGTGNSATEPTTDEWSAKTMRFTSRSEVMTGRFYIEAPTTGLWQVTAYPLSAAQYFVITPTSGDIDVMTDNGKAEFTVSVNTDLSPTSTQTLYFNVSLYFNGEWHDANSEFNRKNIKLVLDAN